MQTADMLVVGLGAMGSSAACALALRGARVIGFDQHHPPHRRGSSSGDTRITRLAVGEGDAYLPLVSRSHELWRLLEERTGRTLLTQCGGLVMGVPDSAGQHGIEEFAAATRRIAQDHEIPHEVLSASQITERFGVLAATDELGCYEPTAGYLDAPGCITAHLEVASLAGAVLRTGERVQRWSSDGATVRVTTDIDTYEAAGLVLAGGPWMAQLVPDLAGIVSVQRQVMHWFDVESRHEEFEGLPVFIWLHGTRPGEHFYGFPMLDGERGGIKVAAEHYGAPTTPEDVERTVSEHETASMHEHHVKGRLLGVSSRCLRAEVCLYTVTPDHGFVIDAHAEHRNVVIASACSGHGFKHSAAIGECAAALCLDGTSPIDLHAFRLDRFG